MIVGGAATRSGRSVLVGDFVWRDGASVAGPNAANVGQRQQAGDARPAHAGAVQVYLRQVHAFQVFQTWGGQMWRVSLDERLLINEQIED